ncbi:hypothetical protein EXIGLDRAFT_730009 [Exidia glandulosa HHB12029]|uniref:DUF7598 domain-containing protein n=1 Tax=Exidia glandulosa HHB12029 TaxID=1314781 RepID=A0A165CC80_EXIGL|nr:hypothetical protein EXIGLDRAFT_730009 [Exidia glandulosa HHB12029]
MQPRVAVFLGLNAVRFFSLVGLILVFASSIVVLVNDIHAIQRATSPQVVISNGTDSAVADDSSMVDCEYLENSTVPNQPAGPFWAVVNRFLIIFEIMILFLSEVGWPQKFFSTFFPVLGPDFGVGALGIFECLIGASILSHRVNEFALVSAFFLFAVGCLNIFFGLVFREKSKTKRMLTEWHDKPTLPQTNVQLQSGAASFISNAEKPVSITSPPPAADYSSSSFRGYGFGRQGEKAAGASGLKGFLISKPLETLPRYAPKAGPSDAGNRNSQTYPSGGAAI